MNAIREQMLKAGLVTEEQAEKAKEQAKRNEARQRNRGQSKDNSRGKGSGAKGKPSGQNPKNKPAHKPNNKPNKKPAQPVDSKVEHKAVTRQVAKKDQVNKIIRDNLVKSDDSTTYHFPRKDGKLRSVSVSEAVREALAGGEMAIVSTLTTNNPFAVVSKETALQIKAIQPHRILSLHDGSAEEAGSGNPLDDEAAAMAAFDEAMKAGK